MTNARMPSRWASRWLLLPVLALALLLRLPFLSLPLTVDEGAYAYVAYWWLRGETLYDRVWIDRPQGLFVVFAAILRLIGESPEAIRLGVALLNLGTTALVYAIARRLCGAPVALTAAALYTVLSAHPRIEGVIANAEIVMALPATLSLWLVLAALDRARPGRWLLGAGVAAGVAFLVKQSGVAALLLDLTVLALAGWKPAAGISSRLARAWVRAGVWVLTGAALPVVLSAAHGLATAPVGYWEALAGHRLAYGSVASYSLGEQARAWLANALAVWPAVTPFVLVAFGGLVLGPRPEVAWSWLLWSGGALTLGGEWWGHYYVQVIPPLALLAAQGAWSLATRTQGLVRAGLAGMALAGGLTFLADLGSYLAAPGTPAQAARYSNVARYQVSAAIAAYLREQTPPDRGVYVAYEGAEIIYQAQRLSPVRYLFRTDLFVVPGAYEAMLATLADPGQRPAAVVAQPEALAGPGGPGDGRLAALLARDYRPAAAFGAWQVYLER